MHGEWDARMINLSLFWFLALLEFMVLLLIVIGVLVWRLRRPAGKDRIQFIDGAEDYPTPALYLEAEVARTRTHLESLSAASTDGEPDLTTDPVQPALALRAALLEVEAELSHSQPQDRDVKYWQALATRLGDIVAATGYSAAAPEPAPESSPAAAEPAATKTVYVMGEEDASVTGLVEQQAKTIDFLRNYIQELLDQHGHEPSPDPDIAGKFNELERANKELSSCVAVLEDENEFLRDQIAALLKIET